MIRSFFLLAAALLAVTVASSDLGKGTCAQSANNCTASSQRAQASAFCSSFVGPTPTTRFIYPNIQTRSLNCRRHGPAPPNPTLQSLPSQLQPPPAPTITTSPTPPACLGNATAASQVLDQCSCLGVARSTTTSTYTPTITMLGPMAFEAQMGGKALAGPPLHNVSYQGNTVITDVPLVDRNNGTSFWLDQFGRLFDSNPPTIPFSLASSSLQKQQDSYVEQVFYSAAYDGHVPVLCKAAFGFNPGQRSCTLLCKPFGDPNHKNYESFICINNPQSCSPDGTTSQMWWALGKAKLADEAECFPFGLLVYPSDRVP